MLRSVVLIPVSFLALAAADQPWKDKQIADWNDDDTKLILSDSPWAKSVDATVEQPAARGRTGNSTGRGGLGGIGLGIPGIGRRGIGGYPGGGYPGGGYPGGGYPGGGYPGGGYPGGGYPGGGYPGGGYPTGQQPGGTGSESASTPPPAPKLTLRWESAAPIREAELKARDTKAPTVDESKYYAIAVYGVPSQTVNTGSQTLAGQLKKQASIKRDGKKDLAPTRVDVLDRENGPVFVYLFPRSKELNVKDARFEFDAKIGRLSFSQSFYPDDMMFQGKLEL
jgi:hypothetical protein